MPWTALIIFSGIAVSTTVAVAIVCAAMGWTIVSPAWSLLVPVAMWAPAAGRHAARRFADRDFRATLPLRRWGTTGAQVVLRPLFIPLAIYGVAYVIAWYSGLAHWNPGEGRWTTGRQVAANLALNLPVLGVLATLLAMGEELGWRGYLQPRLDAAGIRASIFILWLVQVAYHAPLMLFAGYADTGGGTLTNLALFTIGDLPITFILAHEAYRAHSLWPAVFLHGFHNTISQWLYPKLFTVDQGQIWLQGEAGVLPMAGYAVLGTLMFLAMRRRRQSWHELARQATRSASSGDRAARLA